MRAAFFDLDGLLIDSEPLWRAAEVEVFGGLGVPIREDDCAQTTGLRVDAVVSFWFERHPWTGPAPGEVEARIVERVRELITRRGAALPGALDAVDAVRRAGWRVGLASSSPPVLIDAAVERLGLRDAFECRCSAFDEARGKPDPAVYLTAIRRLAVDPARSIALEDSAAGVAAARAAGLRVVAVPERFDDPRFDVADWKLRSLEAFSVERLASSPEAD
ncbi:MAG: hexitol phosphatase HxpB [Acidobacteriota bacterium]